MKNCTKNFGKAFLKLRKNEKFNWELSNFTESWESVLEVEKVYENVLKDQRKESANLAREHNFSFQKALKSQFKKHDVTSFCQSLHGYVGGMVKAISMIVRQV